MSDYESLEMAERFEMDIDEKDELITKQAEQNQVAERAPTTNDRFIYRSLQPL